MTLSACLLSLLACGMAGQTDKPTTICRIRDVESLRSAAHSYDPQSFFGLYPIITMGSYKGDYGNMQSS